MASFSANGTVKTDARRRKNYPGDTEPLLGGNPRVENHPRNAYFPFACSVITVIVAAIALLFAFLCFIWLLGAFTIPTATIKSLTVTDKLGFDGPICPENVTIGSAEFPTIQSFFDFYKLLHSCPVKVRIPLHTTWNEYLDLGSTQNSLRTGELVHGVALIGDGGPDRYLSGVTYAHSAKCATPIGSEDFLGAVGDDVTLSMMAANTMQIAVSGSTLNLTAGGFGVGDKVLVRDDTNVLQELDIASVGADTVTFVANNPITVADGTYIVFLPSVKVVNPTSTNPTLSLANQGLAIRGIWFQLSVPDSRDNLVFSGGNVALDGCFFDDRNGYSLYQNIVPAHGAQLTGRQYTGDLFSGLSGDGAATNTILGGNFHCLEMSHQSTLDYGHWNLLDCGGAGLGATSSISVTSLTSIQNGGIFTHAYCLAGAKFESQYFTAIQTHNSAFTAVYIFDSHAGFNVWGALRIKGSTTAGIYAYTTATIFVEDGTIDGPDIGTSLGYATSMAVGTDLVYSNNALVDIETVHMSSYSALNSALTPNSIFTHTASGALRNAFTHQKLGGGAALDITLDTTAGFLWNMYQGKPYTVRDASGYAHTITLEGSAVFEGCGVPAGTNQIEYDTTVGAYAQFKIESGTIVHISSHNCVTFNTVAKKRAIVHPRAHMTPPMTKAELMKHGM
jgi:hypothetical protein